ncbi:MAG: hypothetical protein IKR60_02990 [Alphaproteobacteria bacterium]|nr:hypothetical protein [Alphaproteobacteria bacterium]
MKKKNIFSLMLGVTVCSMLYTCPARAQWPTLDISAVFNNIKTFVAQGQAQVSTVQETVSTVNIQQSIGDKLGGLNKLKDLASKKDALEAKIAKQKQRLEKINEMRSKYDEAMSKVDEAKSKVDDAKAKVDDAKAKVDDAKGMVDNAKAQAQGALDQGQQLYQSGVDAAKSQAQGVLNQGQQLYQNTQDKVNDVRGVENTEDQPTIEIEDDEEVLGKKATLPQDTNSPKAFTVKNDTVPAEAETKELPAEKVDAVIPKTVKTEQTVRADKTLKDTKDLWDDEGGKPVVSTLVTSPAATKPALNKNIKLTEPVDLWDEEEKTPGVVTLGTSSGVETKLQKGNDKVTFKVPTKDATEKNDEIIPSTSGTFSSSPVNAKVNVAKDVNAKINLEKDDGIKRGVVTLGTSSGVTNAVAISTETIKEPVVSPVVSGADETKNVQNLKQTNTTKEKLLNKSRGATTSGPKAFKKVSYKMETSISFAQEGRCNLFGTNADGNRVLPDELAAICCIGYDGSSDKDFTINEDVAMKCIDKLCAMMSGGDAAEAAENKKKFNKIRAQVVASSFAVGNTMKQKYLDTSAMEKELEKVKDSTSGEERSQTSGNGELTTANINTQRDLINIRASDLELSSIEAVANYCQNSTGEAEETEAPKKFGTNSDGNRILPDKLADICDIGYTTGSDTDPEVNEEIMTGCINKICHMLNASNTAEAANNKKKFHKIYAQAISHSMAVAYEMKQKYLNTSKMDDEFDKIKEDTSDDMRSQTSGNSELSNADINAQKDLLLIKASDLELSAIDAIATYCQNYASADDE